jgi:hypothetical protein
MKPLTERQIRGSFINLSKGESQRLSMPRDFDERPWEDLDFLGWREPGALDRAYLVAERDGGLVGVALRVAGSGASRGFTATGICSLCQTARTGGDVALMTARRTGEAGRQGNSVGQHMCVDLACSLFLRGAKVAATDPDYYETLTLEDKIERMNAGIDAFLARVRK